MKIKKELKIELCASKDSHRLALHHPYLCGDKLVATDGRRLMVLPVEREEGDVDGQVSRDALTLARKQARKNQLCAVSCADKATLKIGDTTMPRPQDQYPNWKQVIPSEGEHVTKISFNAKWLYEMAQAMGGDTVTIAIKDEVSPLVVTTTRCPGAHGVLMPIRLS